MILVFGQTGQVGQALAALPDTRSLGRDAADFATDFDPAPLIGGAGAVIIAAAYTAVDAAEEDETTATAVNATTPGRIARACAAQGVPLVHISTDYVFDGGPGAPWRPDSRPAPLNAYGRTKLAGEEAIRASGARHAILRTSWVFSATGQNFVKTMLRLAETRDALSVVDDQTGGPTPAEAIAEAAIQVAQGLISGHRGGTWHLSGTPATTWAGFAREIFAQAGRDVTVTGIPTSDYPTPARRPLDSRLDCASLDADFGLRQPDWKAGLARVLRALEDDR